MNTKGRRYPADTGRNKSGADESCKKDAGRKTNQKMEDQYKTASSDSCYGRSQSGAVLVSVGTPGRCRDISGKFGTGKMV